MYVVYKPRFISKSASFLCNAEVHDKCVLHSRENNTISVWNNGKGIPVVEHKVEKVFVPALIFGQLLTSSNYDDDEKKVTGEHD